MAEQERGVQQLEVPRQRFRGHKELGSIPGDTLRTSGATMATTQAAGLEGRGRSTGTGPGLKASLSQRVQELRTVITLQEQGRKIFTLSCEEKLGQNRQLLPRLREAVKEDIHALDLVQKYRLTVTEACRAQKPLGIALARKTVEVAQEKLRAKIYERVNTCNMLLYQLRQRSRALGELQRQLQQLQDVQMSDKRHQAQVQVIRQLENSIEKMLMKVHAGQKVTTLYLAVRNVLKKELDHLPLHLDLLYGMTERYHWELEDMELMALSALKAADVTKEEMTKMETQFRAERELRYRSLAAQNVPVDRLWLKEASEKHLKAQARYDLAMDLNLHLQDPVEDTKLKATKSQMEREAWVTEKMEKAKAAVQCSRLWDIPSRLLAQQKSSVDLEQYVNECKEKQQALKEKLKELELKQAELKFRQPPNTTRVLEEQLRMNLQLEKARLEQMRAQMLRNQELLVEFENGIDNLFVRLHGITVPDQDDSVKASGVEDKLRHCEQKLQYLLQRVADLPPESHSPDENNETFVKVRNFLEKTTANDPQNLKISLDDIGSSIQDPFDFADKDHGLVLTREDIKKQGLHLIESKKKASKKK
ncbi:coiled-coil domain-containing protein 183 [Rissa tridactyla]|uniref:coiled-coil domain-containing protein 183 n=1 Tax=Rissa tridactyla TaxID=75485 RepID=UPI0023BAA42D|nr:coiled-coil domain-containing protein 183 [Rissa tridactyla]